MSAILLLIGILSFAEVKFTGAYDASASLVGAGAGMGVGVCYGNNGDKLYHRIHSFREWFSFSHNASDNLPTPQEVVNLYKSNGIGRMRIYDPDEGTLQALGGSNIEVILGVLNDNLQSLTDASAAQNWVNNNVKAYSPDVKFKYIAVGNGVEPNDPKAKYVLPAMQNIQKAISSANLQGKIKVSTAIETSLLANSYPPNDGVFSDSASQFIKPIINFLVSNGAPLLANVYPYFPYVNNQQSIGLHYALFTKQGKNEVGYQNLFDSILDSLYSALEKAGGSNVNVVVSESGWPSEGGVGANVGNAGTYYRNLINHVKGGTPKRPNGSIETYLFAMFDENHKNGAEIEKHFGVFRPDKSPKYQLSFK